MPIVGDDEWSSYEHLSEAQIGEHWDSLELFSVPMPDHPIIFLINFAYVLSIIFFVTIVYNYLVDASWGKWDFLRNDSPSRLFTTVLAMYVYNFTMAFLLFTSKIIFHIAVLAPLLSMILWMYREYRAGHAEAADSAG